MPEFDLIERIRTRVVARGDVVLGIGDDAALVRVPSGRELAVAMDTLNEGVHFPAGTAPAHIGWKALAVNLSDLAAMGAEPAWCTLSLSLPQARADWLDAFIDGFTELAAQHGVALIGGDTTRGPLSVCVTVHGFVEPGHALRRAGAHAGDTVWVSGTLGGAAAALRLLDASEAAGTTGAGHPPDALRTRLDRPMPRVALGRRLIGVANAAIDISDGLFADLGHLCRASGVSAALDIDALPGMDALHGFDPETRRQLQASGGDDYELCFTAAAAEDERVVALAREAATPVTRIGRINAGQGICATTAAGQPWQPPCAGYQHFAG